MNNAKQLTLDWILKYNRTPYPYSLQSAALKGLKPKQPCFFSGRDYLKPVDWKDYQDWGSLDKNFRLELIKAWHGDSRIEGIGCNAGFNGEFYFSMVDIDRKTFESLEAMEQAVTGWENRNPEISSCPRSKTQSGGYRYYVGFESVDKDWGNTISFTFTQGGEKSLGELMTGPGGLGIILGKGLKEEYLWDRNSCGEVLVFPNPESIGLFQVEKAIAPSVGTSIYDNPDIPEQAREALSFIPVNQFDGDYQGWINIGMACRSAGLDCEDWDNWSRGSKEYSDEKTTFNHWKSFKDGGGITAATLFKFAKDNGYKPPRKQQQTQLINTSKPNYQTSGNTALKPEQQAETQSNVLQFPRQQPQLNIEDIEDELKTLAEQNLSKSKQQLKINELAKKVNLQPRELQDIFKNYLSEIEDTDSLDDIKTELDDLLKNKNQSLNLSEYLPGHLVKISEFATRLRLRPETALTAFLATCSSLLKVGSKIHLSGYSNFSQPMGIYAAIVAEPSQQKSPLISEIILEPLSKLAEIEQQNFENELKNYQIEYQLWEQDKTSGGEPEKPVMRNHYITGSSQAGIRNLLDKQSQKGWGVLQISDELAGAYKNSGKSYNVGQMEDDLSYYDARGTSEALKDGLVTNNKKCLFSKFGGIQPGVIRDFLNGTDNNGYWSRWTFINQPVSPMFIPDDDDSSLTVQPMLTDFYNKLSELPLLQLRLEPKAEKQFNRIQNKCEVNRVNAKTPALAALWGKIRGKIGRYAALIHVIEQVALFGSVQNTDVNLATLKKASALAKFYFNESQSLYAACTEGSLPANLAAIIELAKKENAPITASKVKQFEKTIFGKIDVADIRVMFIKLSEMGHGQLEGSGSRLKFSNCSNCSKTVEGFSTVETPSPIGLHPTVVTVEEKNKNFTETNQQYLDVTLPLEVTEDSKKPSTVTTVGYNPDTVCDVAVEIPSTVPTTVTTVSTVCSDRTPEPVENKNTDFDGLDVGDVLIAEFKELHLITARRGQQWLTHRGEYVSRTALQNQDFKVPTVGEMVTAIEKAYINQDSELAHLLAETFKNDPLSLFCQAIATDKNLEIIYTL